MLPGAQMEAFSAAYLCAVAAAASIKAVKEDTADDDSVDWTLKAGPDVFPNRPEIDVQLKCCYQDIVGPAAISYQLKRKNYDDLRTLNVSVPRILIVVMVPRLTVDWSEHTEDQLLLRRCGYWFSLRGLPTATGQRKSVHIPRTQQFNPAQLLAMLQRVNEGGHP